MTDAENAMMDLMFSSGARVTIEEIQRVQQIMELDGIEKEQIARWGAFMRMRVPNAVTIQHPSNRIPRRK